MSEFANLSRPQKAAVILVAMGKPAAGRLLKFFKQEELKALVEAARLLRTIPQAALERIVVEFEAEFTEGAGLMDSGEEIGNILTETLSPEEMTAIMGQGKPIGSVVNSGMPPVWPELEKLDPARLSGLVATEHPQTAAVILSQIAPTAAAGALLPLEKAFRGEIIRRMMATNTVPPAALKLAEAQLRRKLQSASGAKDAAAGHSRVASLLNEMDRAVLDEVMQDLEASGTPGLAAIRAKLFSFEDSAALTQKARVSLFDGISSEQVTLALRNADATLTEAVLSAIGARSRRMIEAELSQGSDGFAVAEIARARKQIAATAIRMAGEGAFALPSAEGESQAAA